MLQALGIHGELNSGSAARAEVVRALGSAGNNTAFMSVSRLLLVERRSVVDGNGFSDSLLVVHLMNSAAASHMHVAQVGDTALVNMGRLLVRAESKQEGNQQPEGMSGGDTHNTTE